MPEPADAPQPNGDDAPGRLPGSDEFRRDGDDFGPVLEEGSFGDEGRGAKPAAPPARPSGSGEKALVLSTATATVVLLGGMLALYGLFGGFDPIGRVEEPPPAPEARPAPAEPPPLPPSDADLAGLSRGQLERLAAQLREDNASLKRRTLNLDLEVRRWKERVEPIDETYLEGVMRRFLSGTPDERAGARRVLLDRGGPVARALVAEVEARARREAALLEELRSWREKAQASVAAVLRLETRLGALRRTKAVEEAQAFYRRGIRQESAGELPKAAASFTRALELDPSLAAAFHARGLVRLRQERPAEALEDFESAAALDAGSAIFERNRARALLALDRIDEARSAAKKALSLRPGDPETLRVLDRIEGRGTDD